MRKLAMLLLFLGSIQAYGQREFQVTEGDTTFTMKRYVFMLLNAGENRDQDSLKTAVIQAGHMAHLNKMAESGKLIVAGPFEKGGQYKGLLIFDVETVDEAMTLASEDPAVKAGRLKLNAFYWWGAKGTLIK